MASEGANVVDLGVLPTPGVAWLSERRTVPAAMVSASHNPFSDNGVKLFAAGGLKLPDSVETSIEDELVRILEGHGRGPRAPVGHAVGNLSSDPDGVEQYADHLVATVPPGALDGLSIVVDCANGAGSAVAAGVLERLGAKVLVIAGDPDGSNINDACGSTHPEMLAETVVRERADLGLALDGDADRLVAVDHEGHVRTGDELLVIFAADLADRGQLAGNTVAVTVMSNLGLHRAMAERNILVRQTPVGDRYVLEALDSDGLSLGGEQSGHLVFRRLATTGDGTLTGILLADLVNRSGRYTRAACDRFHDPRAAASCERDRRRPRRDRGARVGQRRARGRRLGARRGRPGAREGERDRACRQGDGGGHGRQGCSVGA